ncbi:primase, DNA, polypeptide 1 (49kDa) [Rhizophlyctis rosea]|uniref:DNA primase n=1 Tax=Rhizophlyctis rosea TaxID=64517 RepID=A0AAD5SRL8_9FUNG|nr:primase, DNA, polypeptide 1 (49kDa) [Rhizophlyctis rosea]
MTTTDSTEQATKVHSKSIAIDADALEVNGTAKRPAGEPQPSPSKRVKVEEETSMADVSFGDEADDELLASMDLDYPVVEQPSKQLVIPVIPAPAASSSSEEKHFIELLKVFYQWLFPWKLFYRWLSYGNVNKHVFQNREFSFTLPGDTYMRFQSYKDIEELKAHIIKFCPVKIDLGAVYNMKPKDKKAVRPGAFHPWERELVFDIDMTDYDEVRTCCSGGDICRKCWDFMTISIKIIDRILREDFGFKHILWVYSGRRGVHCWVCDERARKLTPEARRAIVSYMEVVKGGEGVSRKVFLRDPLHSSLRYAERVLEEHFEETILDNMKVLDTQERWSKVLAIIPYEEIRNSLDSEFQANEHMSSAERWDRIVDELARRKKGSRDTVKRDIIFQYTYPRLDSNVSIGLNHLLKSPFCVHPKTGRVCVPIDPRKCEEFDPFAVPELSALVDELNSSSNVKVESGADGEEGEAKSAGTSLDPHIKLFKAFLSEMDESIRESLRNKRAEEDRKLNF